MDEEANDAPNVDTVTPQRTEFAAVVFQRIPETYPSDAHIECKYIITPDLVPTKRDWVGLYKVGWMTTRDYYYYEWAQTPADYEVGKEMETGILFPAHKLPGEDGEFYQFCYVTSSGQIRGASTPFQFKNPSADDFVELDDEETDMLIIRSKTVVLEENVRRMEDEQETLLQVQHDLESERNGLVTRVGDLEKQIITLTEANQRLEDQVKAGENYIAQLNQEAKDMMVTREEIQNKCDAMQMKMQDLDDNLTTKEEDVKGLHMNLKKMTNEKDELAGENRTLKEQMELYKNHFTTSESSAQEYGRQIDELRIELAKQESLVTQLKRDLKDRKAELDESRKKSERQKAVTDGDKNQIDMLNEKLRNTEDKLEAAEKVKVILQSEIETYEENREKMSKDLEKSEGECYTVKQQLATIESQMMKEMELLKAEIVSTQHDLKQALEEKHKLQEEIGELNQSKETTENSMSSLHCLKVAQTSLKERYAKMEQNYSELQTEFNKKKKENSQNTKDLLREIEDLKERLSMAAKEYKTLYIEKKKYQKAAEKLEKRLESVGHKSLSLNSGPEILVQKLQTAADCQALTSSISSITSEDSAAKQLQSDLDDVSSELEKRQDKKIKYKKLYAEEKQKLETVTRRYEEEMRKKDEEIERLRKCVQEVSSENDMKIRSLENYLANKESTIEELNRKLRDNNKMHDSPVKSNDGEKGSHKSESNMYPRGAYPVMMYSSPYPQGPMCYPGPIVYPQAQPVLGPDGKPLPPLRYPDGNAPQVFPPIRYPTVPPPKYPETPFSTQNGAEVIVKQPTPVREADHLSNDPAGIHTDKSVPLKPLPVPLEPERLSSSKLTAVKSVLMENDKPVSEISVNFGSNHIKVQDELDTAMPSAPPAHFFPEERFEDAIGEAMKICPVCNESFSSDIDQGNFDAHVLSHVHKICPVCHNMIEDVDDNGFEYHVNQHLDQKQLDEQ